MVKNLLFHESIGILWLENTIGKIPEFWRLSVDFMVFKIGVAGSSGKSSKKALEKAFELGRQIALHGCVLVTGGCGGIPHSAVLGAKSIGGKTFGISPAKNAKEHLEKFRCPLEDFDELIFTGNGKLERNIVFVAKCNAIIFAGGRLGTLNELTVAVADEKTIGLLKGTGGIADNAEKILKMAETNAEIASGMDCKKLLEKVLEKLKN